MSEELEDAAEVGVDGCAADVAEHKEGVDEERVKVLGVDGHEDTGRGSYRIRRAKPFGWERTAEARASRDADASPEANLMSEPGSRYCAAE